MVSASILLMNLAIKTMDRTTSRENSVSGPAYGHFTVEHNSGHHVKVSTPEDPASSRMGESIYSFAIREIPATFNRAWLIEASD